MRKLFITAAMIGLLLSAAGVANATDYSDPNNWGDDGDSLFQFEFKPLDPRLNSIIKQNAEQN